MSIRMLRLRLTLIASSSVSLFALSAASGQQAEAVSDALIVQNLATELDDVQLGRMEILSEERSREVAGLQGIGFRFEHDFNSDGQRELVLLGDYAEGDKRRSFVLIARPDAGGQWARSRLFTFDEEFVIARRYDLYPDRLSVFFCTDCDVGGRIEWTGSDFEFRPFRPVGVQ